MKPLPLLLAGALLHYGWYFVPPEHQALAWNIAGALARAGLLLALVWHVRSRVIQLVAAWWLAEEAMVAGCNAWFIVKPWKVEPGQAMCSSLLQIDLGILGVAAMMGLLMACLPIKVDSYRKD